MDDCIFCRIYEENLGIIYENELFFSRFDAFPVTPGHAEVIPIKHVESFFDLNVKDLDKMFEAIKETKEIIEGTDFREVYREMMNNPVNEKSKKFCKDVLGTLFINKKPDGYNIGINDGRSAGRTVDHLHIHLIPRYSGDMKDPTGGVRYVIPEKGNYR